MSSSYGGIRWDENNPQRVMDTITQRLERLFNGQGSVNSSLSVTATITPAEIVAALNGQNVDLGVINGTELNISGNADIDGDVDILNGKTHVRELEADFDIEGATGIFTNIVVGSTVTVDGARVNSSNTFYDLGNQSGSVVLDRDNGQYQRLFADAILILSGITNMNDGESLTLQIDHDSPPYLVTLDQSIRVNPGWQGFSTGGTNAVDVIVFRKINGELYVSADYISSIANPGTTLAMPIAVSLRGGFILPFRPEVEESSLHRWTSNPSP